MVKLRQSALIVFCVFFASIMNKFVKLMYITLDDCFLDYKSTSTGAHYVGCGRHEVHDRRGHDSNLRTSDLWPDTRPMDFAFIYEIKKEMLGQHTRLLTHGLPVRSPASLTSFMHHSHLISSRPSVGTLTGVSESIMWVR